MNNIVQLILKYLPFLIQASASVPQIIEFIHKIRDIFKREELWTPEQEAAFDEKLAHVRDDPAWQRND